jgi:hypothetical protein
MSKKSAKSNGELDKGSEFKLTEMNSVVGKKKEKPPKNSLKTLYLFADKLDV